jgi:hypothetical protein
MKRGLKPRCQMSSTRPVRKISQCAEQNQPLAREQVRDIGEETVSPSRDALTSNGQSGRSRRRKGVTRLVLLVPARPIDDSEIDPQERNASVGLPHPKSAGKRRTVTASSTATSTIHGQGRGPAHCPKRRSVALDTSRALAGSALEDPHGACASVNSHAGSDPTATAEEHGRRDQCPAVREIQVPG